MTYEQQTTTGRKAQCTFQHFARSPSFWASVLSVLSAVLDRGDYCSAISFLPVCSFNPSNQKLTAASSHQTVNGSGTDTRREIQGKDGKRWEEVINMKDKERKEVMMVPEIVQLKVMRKVKKVNRMEQVKKGIESHMKRRLSKRETAVNLDPIDDTIKESIATDQLKKKVPSLSGFVETFIPQVTTPEILADGGKEIKSLIDAVRFPDEAVDGVVDGIRTRIDSLIPDKVKEIRQKTEAKAVEVLQPIILSASQLFNLNPLLKDEEIEKESSKDAPSLAFPSRSKNQPSDSGLFHVFRGVLG